MTGLMLTAGAFMAGCGILIAVPHVCNRLYDRRQRRHLRACGELLAAQAEAYLRGVRVEEEPVEEDPWDTI